MTRWSSEFTKVAYRDIQAKVISVDSTGSYVILPGKNYIAVKNLQEPSEVLYKYPRQCKNDVEVAEWNTDQHQRLCALSSSKKIELLRWTGGNLALAHCIQAHSRFVNSLSWNYFDSELLASSSLDKFVHLWDLKDIRRPFSSFSTVEGASCVRWNKQNSYVLATTHSGDIKLWDRRKGILPVDYICAHPAKIYCIDWDSNHENRLATSSQDGTVKLFDIRNPKRAENIINASEAVWKAKFTPFGSDSLVVAIPPRRRGEDCLLLWSLSSNLTTPVHTFVGHTDIVLEMQWINQPGTQEYQLITWSKDDTLRIWQIDSHLQQLCGIETNSKYNINSTQNESLLSHSPKDSDVIDARLIGIEVSEAQIAEPEPPPAQISLPKSLQQEFSMLDLNLTNTTFQTMDADKRECVVSLSEKNHLVELKISFPPCYPYNVPPIFDFSNNSTPEPCWLSKVLKVIKQIAQQRVKRNKFCLEPCIKQLASNLEELCQEEKSLKTQGNPLLNSETFFPYPRTCGAKFCGPGYLVCFGLTPSGKQCLSKVEKSSQKNISHASHCTPTYLYILTKKARLGRGVKRKRSKACIMLYDVSELFPFSKELAINYIFDSQNVVRMCEKNSLFAAKFGRPDLARVWSLAALAATQNSFDQDEELPWDAHPLSIGMIRSLILHYARDHDVQMAAMLCCAFSSKIEPPESLEGKTVNKASPPGLSSRGGSPYHTIHRTVDSSVESWSLPVIKQTRSNSWSESLDDFSIVLGAEDIIVHSPLETTEAAKPINSRPVLEDSERYELYKKTYVELLHHWCLLNARTQVMKYVQCSVEDHKGLELVAECLTCKQPCHEPYCSTCRNPSFVCVMCHLSVKGSASVCLSCGHGGHTKHMADWFSEYNECPSGCGCYCLQETVSLLEPWQVDQTLQYV